ncbi:MAG: RagB/SusD family nutrient uptake outer membrane protein [Mucilaginibacter sp.]|nr:RagB/SusD family nutrient uptake outer membrane protein [Mucilaginibacter sp.]
MKKIILLGMGIIMMSLSCKKALDQQPQGVVSSDDLNTPVNIEKMVIAAYSSLGDESIVTPNSLWSWGSLRSGDALKGGDGLGDNSGWNDYEQFVTNRPNNTYSDQMWAQLYNGIARANDALVRVNAIDVAVFPNKVSRQAELRFLRGNFYFMLKVLYNKVPYIIETDPKDTYIKISNDILTSDALWGKIADDFKFALANLPESQADIGRPNKYTAAAYLAKVLLYQAYKQDDNHNVTSVDQALLQSVITNCDLVIGSGKYALSDDFAKNFLTQYENGPESVFAIQYSQNDGTKYGRIDMGHSLSYTLNADFGCCGFHVPSQDMVNSFKTDNNGLPMFAGYNDADAVQGTDFMNFNFDPRLEHSVAIPGHPFKYDAKYIFDRSWTRAPATYGAFASLKDMVPVGDPSFQRIPPFMSSSKNWEVIRYADVLLWKAEALIELSRETEALPLINQVRQRAANSVALLKKPDGTYPSKYKMTTYQPGVNATWTNSFARQALRTERRMEFAMEGYRFFDLVRWGIADTFINSYLAVESTKHPYLKTAHFTKGRDEYLPIPTNQISFSKGLYKQNPGF